MATGTVKWFNEAKGFGFIAPGKIACYDKEIRPCFYLLTVNRVKITFAQRQIMNGIQ